jgi:hypothetical protein
VAVIRELLLVLFTAKDLRQFCQRHTAFRPVFARFGPACSLADMVGTLVEYCEEDEQYPQSLIELRKWPLPWYEDFEGQIFGRGSRQ